jgi:hypothetical protein
MFLLSLFACFHSSLQAPPFACQGAAAPPAAATAVAPMGMVAVESISEAVDWTDWRFQQSQPSVGASVWGVASPAAAVTTPSAQDWFNQKAARAHLSVAADAAPLHQLVIALGQNLALDMHVSQAAGQKVVTAFYQDTSLATFLQQLRIDHGVSVGFSDGTLMFDVAGAPCAWCGMPLVTTLFETADLTAEPAALAAVFCQDLASPVGSAAVVGDQLYVRDVPTTTDTFRAFYDHFIVESGE